MQTDPKVLYGVKAIAAFLGVRQRQALYMVEQNRLPHYRIGRAVCANPEKITEWLRQQERATAKGGN